MKKVFVFIHIILFSYTGLFSQTTGKTINLNTVNPGGIYTARDMVTLKPGFSFNPVVTAVPKIVIANWKYSGSYVNWAPSLIINS